ncbi:Folate receptor-like [Heracleum sosnowskyi]|uniref:Folate receptor-like n=1 Tax=Heracleum sosnowskyi TaxID=360622 RepID=A0AAD8HPX3_9APIA|nr:Folate receptor-like [Heracleum sosnowskyi]
MSFSNTILWLLLLLTLASFDLIFSSSSDSPNGVCSSMGGRFPPYTNEGKPPRRVNKGPKDLTLCRVFRKRTCCDVAQTHPAFLTIRKLASTGEASEDCLQLWELLECSICDPEVGVQSGPPLVCSTFCDRVYEACSSAYFSMDVNAQVLAPCGVNDFVCGRASEWISNGSELCRASGFSVKPLYDQQERSCYGGKSSLDAIADSWKPSRYKVPHQIKKSGLRKGFQQWVTEVPFNEKVSWAVAGMVLTAGVLFKSRRKRRRQHQIQAAIQRNAKKIDQNLKPKSPVGQTNRMGSRR